MSRKNGSSEYGDFEVSNATVMQEVFDENGNVSYEKQQSFIDAENAKRVKATAKRAVSSILQYLASIKGPEQYFSFEVIETLVAKYVTISEKELRSVINSMVRGGLVEKDKRKFRICSYLFASVEEIEQHSNR